MIFHILILELVLSLALSSPVKPAIKKPVCGYQSCPETDPERINIHLVPHSHDDVGWLQTVDGYYFGHGGTGIYENAAVQYIISSTVLALLKNPERRFIQVETAFLYKWWHDQPDEMKNNFRNLVNNGQIEIINGAWSMNDEAAVHYQSTIDQFTLGLRFLNDTLGECGRPRFGWQIDPFGHSREHASILKQLGFDGFVIGRIDFRDKVKRRKEQALDFMWKSSASLDNSEIFTSIFPDFYGSPMYFCWDVLCQDSPLVDDPDSFEYNLPVKMNSFTYLMDQYSKYYQTNNVLIPMGGDFQYQAAEMNFINMDRLIKAFKSHETYNVFYSTPSCYMKAVREEIYAKSIELPVKTDDFFPYASDQHAFWTGYFTSRPTSKRFERTGNNYLQTASQLLAHERIINDVNYESEIFKLRNAMGIMQHHDAITGTEKQFVAEDYARILTQAISVAEPFVGNSLIKNLRKVKDGDIISLPLENCLLANVSICNNSNKDRFIVTVYNPLSRNVSHFVRLPVQDATYRITGPDGEEIYDILDSISDFDYIPEATPGLKDLVFKAWNIGPFGIKLYYVEKISSEPGKLEPSLDVTFGNEQNGFTIDPDTGLLDSATIQGETLDITQEFLYYLGNFGVNTVDQRSSGAYIFKPRYSEAVPMGTDKVDFSIQKGKLVDEVKQVISDEVTQIIRVYKTDDDPYIEFDWLVGNLDLLDIRPNGKEVITRFLMKDFSNEGIFYTDSNGREQIERKINTRSDYEYDPEEEPVSSNYYPVTTKIVVKDQNQNLQVGILNDRAQGGTSLRDGEIELMVHRRLTHDDAFGVNEYLSEVEYDRGLTVRGQHWLTFGPTDSISMGKSPNVLERVLAKKKLLKPWVMVADATKDDLSLDQIEKSFEFSFAALTSSLPENVNILTFDMYGDDTYILRLEHLLALGEDDILAEPVTVNLKDLFTKFQIIELRETMLGGNTWIDEEPDNGSLEVTLEPMQIRTFIVKTKAI